LAVQAVEPYFKSVSGKLLSAQEPRYLAHGSLYDRAGHLLDELLCVRFAAGQSFSTGEAVVELQAHGGTFHLQSIQKALSKPTASWPLCAWPGLGNSPSVPSSMESWT